MKKTISVFFSGSGFSIKNTIFLAASFYQHVQESESQIKMGFDGNGIVHPVRGTFFGHDMDKQCDEVIQRVIKEINAGHDITLNIYGHSRGGVAALMTAQQLSHINPNKLSINLGLLDPVPGNLITTTQIDPLNITLANKTIDLTACRPLKSVLALYPYGPLPDIICHAPLFASYPPHIELEEDVLPGTHSLAENRYDRTRAAELAKLRFSEFLNKKGTQFDYTLNPATNAQYCDRYDYALQQLEKRRIKRATHSLKGLCIEANPENTTYFNEHHKRLCNDKSEARVAVSIKESTGLFSRLKRKISKNPKAWNLIKWLLLILAVVGLVFVSIGLTALLLSSLAIAKIGFLSLFITMPLIAIAIPTIWYYLIKPVASMAANKFFYPDYSMREIPTDEPLNTPEHKQSYTVLTNTFPKSDLMKNPLEDNASHRHELFQSSPKMSNSEPTLNAMSL